MNVWAAYTLIVSALRWDGSMFLPPQIWAQMEVFGSSSWTFFPEFSGLSAPGRKANIRQTTIHLCPGDHSTSIQFMELPWWPDPVSAFCSSRIQERLILPSLEVHPQPGSLFSWTTEFGPDTFCWRPFPPELILNKSSAHWLPPCLCYSWTTGLRENLAKWTG